MHVFRSTVEPYAPATYGKSATLSGLQLLRPLAHAQEVSVPRHRWSLALLAMFLCTRCHQDAERSALSGSLMDLFASVRRVTWLADVLDPYESIRLPCIARSI